VAGFALSVVVGVLFASLGTLFAGFGALFGDGSQQGGVLGGEIVGRIAQCQHLVNGFGAGFHGFVAGGKLVDAVVEADATSSQAGSGGFEQVSVDFAGGSSSAMGMSVSVIFGSGGRGGGGGGGGGRPPNSSAEISVSAGVCMSGKAKSPMPKCSTLICFV